MDTELNSKTFDCEWVVEGLDFRNDIYGSINRKRVEAAAKLRDEVEKAGYSSDKYDIKIRHHPVGDIGDNSAIGMTSAIVTLKE